jgi:cytosine/adenosine deaminase-related metal-dependent hydrolase
LRSRTRCSNRKLLEEIGLRGIVSLESSQRVSGQNGADCLAQNARTIRWMKEHAQLVRGAMSIHTTFTCDRGFIREAKELSRQAGGLFQFHLSESAHEPAVNRDPTGIYEECGALDENTLASSACRSMGGSGIACLEGRENRSYAAEQLRGRRRNRACA